jgi:hypothetical protein
MSHIHHFPFQAILALFIGKSAKAFRVLHTPEINVADSLYRRSLVNFLASVLDRQEIPNSISSLRSSGYLQYSSYAACSG